MKQNLYDTISQTMVIGIQDNVLLCSFLNCHQSMGNVGEGEGGGHNWENCLIYFLQVSEHIDKRKKGKYIGYTHPPELVKDQYILPI